MKFRFAAVAMLATLASAGVAQTRTTDEAQGIVRANSKPASAGSPDYFTGTASVRPVVDPTAPGRATVGIVTFQPGARSHWHTHPAGQTLYVLDGCGWTQREGGPVMQICKGDAAYVPAGVRHWHGASATSSMVQFSVSETVDGKNVNWMEAVSDADYAKGAHATR